MSQKQYNYRLKAGCVVTMRNRHTKGMVSVYHSAQAGIDTGESPYAAVCETHNTILACSSQESAVSAKSTPWAWCEECKPLEEQYQKKQTIINKIKDLTTKLTDYTESESISKYQVMSVKAQIKKAQNKLAEMEGAK